MRVSFSRCHWYSRSPDPWQSLLYCVVTPSQTKNLTKMCGIKCLHYDLPKRYQPYSVAALPLCFKALYYCNNTCLKCILPCCPPLGAALMVLSHRTIFHLLIKKNGYLGSTEIPFATLCSAIPFCLLWKSPLTSCCVFPALILIQQ